MNQPLQKNKDVPLHNEQIRVPKLRVIVTTEEGEKNLGIIDTKDALRMAYDQSLDLVIINTQVDPQVAKIMDIGKWLYQKSKAEKEKRAADRNRGGQIHELTMRPGIDDHDLDVKVRKIQEWIDDGDRVKITIRFRGRENSRANELGKNLIDRIVSQTGTQREGREEISNNRMSLLLARKTVSK
jgi:translation initiation factor IF-3